jgi:hypothetical protein
VRRLFIAGFLLSTVIDQVLSDTRQLAISVNPGVIIVELVVTIFFIGVSFWFLHGRTESARKTPSSTAEFAEIVDDAIEPWEQQPPSISESDGATHQDRY